MTFEQLIKEQKDSVTYVWHKSNRVDFVLRRQFLNTCRGLIVWLKGKSAEKENKTLQDTVLAFERLHQDHERMIETCEHWQERSDYFELMCGSMKSVERQLEIATKGLENVLIENKALKAEIENKKQL